MSVVAIVGQGNMARAHARAWTELGHDIRYICTQHPGAPLKDAPTASFVTDLEVVLRDADVDIVSICTPPLTHADMAIRALDAGKNVLLEKPVALSVDEGLAILEAGRRSSGVLMVAHVLRFYEGYRMLRRAVEAGSLGSIREARSTRLFISPGMSWMADEAQSGGMLVDFSIHDFDQLNLFLGTPIGATATRSEADGAVHTVVEYQGGGVGEVVTYDDESLAPRFVSSFELSGEGGTASFSFSDGGGNRYRLDAGDTRAESSVDNGNPFVRQAAYFIECIESGAHPEFCPPEAAVLAFALADAARRSLTTGARVAIDPRAISIGAQL